MGATVTLVDQNGDLYTTEAPLYVVFPDDLMTDENGPARRLRVDTAQTGFFARRMFRISYEFLTLAADPIVLKFVCPVNFIIHKQGLEVDQGGVAFRAYRSTQGTEGGTFSADVPIYSVNFMTEQPEYTFQTTIATGGTFTPSSAAVETIRARSSGATAQAFSVASDAVDERGLAAGTYYLTLNRMTGVTGDCKGVYTLAAEERP